MNWEEMIAGWNLFLLIGAGFVGVFAGTPVWIRLGRRWGLLDLPGARKIHPEPLPFTGGLAVSSGFFLVLLVLGGPAFPHLRAILTGSLLILALGYLDDRYDLSPWVKLAGQAGIALLAAGMGLRIHYLTNPFGDMIALGWAGYPLTILWLLATVNMINLIDGLDGLAAGICLLAAASLFAIGLSLNQTAAAFLCALLIGAMAGFLPYNFPPARVFLGNSGAYFLGYLLGAISITGALKLPTILALAVPVFALGVPFLDALWAIWRRWRRGEPVTLGDRAHLHHLLVLSGVGEREAVLLLYGLSLFLGAGSFFLSRVPVLFGMILILVGIVVLFFSLHGLKRMESAVQENMVSPGGGGDPGGTPGINPGEPRE
ncbi:MAG TPA: undecaprenyl/decaprenyl-phosphate alpha-N-acetylglucosaminyl 1-phosphate transferase [Firmicutes bacterium]|nr:undecaprenyl/decaprenyl-phosphate alpha-N-acetylglucosaminyl 1-phosphate transferase [Bacillota bacterium]